MCCFHFVVLEVLWCCYGVVVIGVLWCCYGVVVIGVLWCFVTRFYYCARDALHASKGVYGRQEVGWKYQCCQVLEVVVMVLSGS